jgi:hypothetical protein
MDVYSQTGEDGVIAAILDLLPDKNNWCVEFGAWDGLYLTNTRNLIEARGYSAVLIEADARKFKELSKNFAGKQNVIPLNEFVGFTPAENLDRILAPTPIPKNFDLLSIDIDGNDYHVWHAITSYQPKLVVVEFNPTIPTPVRFVQPADPSINQGSSLLSLVELGKAKGYELVAVLPFNAFFVRQEYFGLFQIENNDPAVLRTNLDSVTYLFCGYDGRIFLRGACALPWHYGIPLRQTAVQRLPRFLQRFPANYNAVQRMLFAIWLAFLKPAAVARAVLARIKGKR